MNPITLYVVKGNLVGFPAQAQRFVGGSMKVWFDAHIATGVGEVMIASVSIGLVILLAWFLHSRKIFLRV
jgi:hypothetical protein